MSSFQDAYSSMLSDNAPNVKGQVLLPEFRNQDIKSAPSFIQVPVLDSEVKPSSLKQDDRKLPYVCFTCSKSFMQKGNLKQHLMIHSGEKPFTCDICQIFFTRKSSLYRHKLTHLKVSKQHNCSLCNEVFALKRDLLMHKKIHLPPKQHNCELCNAVFSRKSDLLKHKNIHKSPKQYKCDNCSNVFNSKSKLIHHVRTVHSFPTNSTKPSSSLKDALFEKVKHFERQNALNVFTATKINSNEENDRDFHIFFNSVRSDVLNELNYQMEEKKSIKWYATVQVIVSKTSQEGDLETGNPYFRSRAIREFNNDNLSTHIDEAFAKINDSFEKFTLRGSGWTLDKILYLEVSTSKYSMP